ncbi:APC family permease [Lacticaseibacillus hulanensis]|uniref:APC family permease n=1 Tax=Lacticaseibacillus hulanensis TaxID=2493111 RepID=UPI000FD6FAE9|nr:APC family permease [Lacticaseibacillus hulanensis]
MNQSKEKLGLFSIILLGINGIIGSGIFLLPNVAAKAMGTAGIFVLMLDAILVILLALCFAQAATHFDRDGGPYLYAKDAFGGFVGFEVGFVTWAIRIIAEATMAVAFQTLLAGIWPVLKSGFPAMATTTFLMTGLALMNIAGVRISKYVNNVVTVAKLVPLVLFVAIGIFFIKGGNFTPMFPGGHYTAGSFGSTAVTMFYAFTGFEGVVVAAGDMKDAKRNLPKAIAAVMAIVALFYVLIQVISTGVLGADALAKTSTPIQAVFAHFAGGFGSALVQAGSLVSVGGILVASSYITPRSGVALAENDMMPAVLAKRNKHNAPWVSILVSLVIGLIISWSGTFSYLAQISVISRFVQYIPTVIAVMVFARKYGKPVRGFSLPFGPVIPVISLVISFWLLYNAWLADTTHMQFITGFGALVVALPFYFLSKFYKKPAEMMTPVAPELKD